MATIVAAAGGGAWTAGPTWVGGVAPTAADDVQLDASSGNVTVGSGSVCRSLDCTGYVGTLTHTAGVTLTIGDGTAGAGNVALRLAAGMTYTLGSASTSATTFASTSASQQTITTAGRTLGNWTVNGAGSSYLLADANTTGSAATVALTAGSLDTGGYTCTWGTFTASSVTARTLTLGASTVTVTGSATAWNIATTTNLTFNAGTSTITATGGTVAADLGTNLHYNTVVFAGAGVASITASGGVGTGTITGLTRTGTATKTDTLQVNTSITVTGTLTVTGDSATNRLLVSSNVIGSTRAVTVNGAVAAANVDISDIVAAGTASWDLSAAAGGSGNGGGCTGITFTTAAPQTWQGTTGGNWSDISKWTSRVPLPQDPITISSAFAPAQTVTMDMPRLGGDITWAGATGAPIWAVTATQSNLFGSLTLTTGMTISGTATALRFRGRGGRTITSNGVVFPGPVAVDSGTSTYTLQDAFTLTSGALTLGSGIHRGSLDTGGQTVTCPTIIVGSASTGSVLTLRSSTVNLTGTAAGAVFTVSSGGSVAAGTSSIVIASASANDRSILAHGYTLGTVTYTVAGSTGRLILGGSGSTGTLRISTLHFGDASNGRGLRLWAGTTVAVLGLFDVAGGSGRAVTVDTSTGGTRATLTKTYGVGSGDWLTVQDIAGVGAWYMGANSVDAGNNTGVSFTDAPAVTNSGGLLAFI